MTKPKALVVEDDEILRKSLLLALEYGGYEVLGASNAKEAIENFNTFSPSVILMDIGLPDMDGVSVAGKIRQLPGGLDVPIVAISGLSARIELAKSSKVNFSAYVGKPILPTRLLEVVNSVAAIPTINDEKLVHNRRILIIDDDPVQLKLLRIHFQNAGFTVVTAMDGNDGFEKANDPEIEIILSDVLMPGIDGFSLCNKIRKTQKNIPIILMTLYYLETKDQEMAVRVGANALVQKILGREQSLLEVVMDHINDRSAVESTGDPKYLKRCRDASIERLEESFKMNEALIGNIKQYQHFHPVFELAIDNVACGIDFLNLSGEIVKTNKFCDKMRGTVSQSALGHKYIEYIVESDRDIVLDNFYKLQESKNFFLPNIQMIKQDGSILLVEIMGALVQDAIEDQVMVIMKEKSPVKSSKKATV